jgi:anoctamin-7
MISEIYLEGPDMKYAEISSVKNYFGEKVGYYFAWMTFYISCLLIPGILGIAISIY